MATKAVPAKSADALEGWFQAHPYIFPDHGEENDRFKADECCLNDWLGRQATKG